MYNKMIKSILMLLIMFFVAQMNMNDIFATVGEEHYITIDGNRIVFRISEEVDGDGRGEVSIQFIREQSNKTMTFPEYVEINGENYNITSIADSAFSGNTLLTSVNLSNVSGLTSIGDDAFAFSNLESITFFNGGENITSIGSGAFQSTQLTHINLSNAINLTTIEDSAFQDSKLESIDLYNSGESKITIGMKAFKGTQLTTIDLSNASKLVEIEDNAFSETPLASINLSGANSLSEIGFNVFAGSTLTSVDLSGATSLTDIGHYAFSSSDLESIKFFNSGKNITYIRDHAFYFSEITTIDLSNARDLIIIGSNAFKGAYNLKSIYLNNDDFADCGGLKDLSNTVTVYQSKTAYDAFSCDIGSTSREMYHNLTVTGAEVISTHSANKVNTANVGNGETVTIKINDSFDGIPSDSIIPNNIKLQETGNKNEYTFVMPNENTTIEIKGNNNVIPAGPSQNVPLLKNLELVSKPTQTNYKVGQPLSLDGIKVDANYEDGSIYAVQENELLVSGYNSNKIGLQTITVNYSGLSTTFTVNVEGEEILTTTEKEDEIVSPMEKPDVSANDEVDNIETPEETPSSEQSNTQEQVSEQLEEGINLFLVGGIAVVVICGILFFLMKKKN